MNEIINTDVVKVLESYPEWAAEKLMIIRKLILDTALEIKKMNQLEETLKWGEPSYVAEEGSTIRIAWKKGKPNQYAMYFNCNTVLVETFKESYSDIFKFEGNRAIVFNENDEIPVEALKHCIELSLTYHRIKHLPMLGI
ncbi:protein of unknown function (DU1801) [Halolactibacillus halophilus]|uniref:YdhG-like domain-containing protein n=1 Tax=Halolactibacillus halophilus TaxID=306540 RepID=A0A1I5T7K5_9BACI|nr:DUF1801 domain-containing protein [Halolactibacillus halophilus]GEM02896.1 hypothetical protein HHA03_24280 [Halolactibacillus halophilus]SFP79019.1 protein of unknown function (DU1801) [Halolactibacillus halophilus]